MSTAEHQQRVQTVLASVAQAEATPPAAAAGEGAAAAAASSGADAPTEGAAAPAGELAPAEGAAPAVEGEDGKPKEGEAAKDPKEGEKKTPDDPKLAARFAALARDKKANVEHEARLEAQRRQIESRAEQFASHEKARLADIDRRETRLREREERDHELLAKNPKALFDHLQSLGIEDWETLKKVGEGHWADIRAKRAADKPAPAAEDPDEKPLTKKELDALWKEREERAQADGRRAQAEQSFAALTGDDAKYEATATLHTSEERIRLGNQIANGMLAKGLSASHEEIAEALNTLAERDPRWQKIVKKRTPQGSSPTAQPKPADASAPKAPASTPARQSNQGPRTLSNDVASESAAAPVTNGAPPAKETHAQRMKRLALGG